MKFFQMVGVALLGLYLHVGNAATETPRSVARTVADWYVKDGSVGLPGAGDEPFKSTFSDALQRSIAAAKAEQAKQEKASPDMKPDYVELSVVTGAPDSVSSYRIVKVRQTGKSAQVTLIWQFKGDPIARTHMLLALQGGRWVITDIIYGTGKAQRSLTKALQLHD
ncbi:hypothetical protein GNZ12_25645 [Paraburkholderia sp. 1N]|uniref:DUF3828 domain-containing protein n=1 Tax=Paraburkholderia solitsugae TaxID=2675748 RepID=A0ABX2BX98_9BURK|nr:hypothetical protein [Paraburkholderia solitsugae]NPT44638.1 hypothetical protein [Paraburkholderia solitsugae]